MAGLKVTSMGLEAERPQLQVARAEVERPRRELDGLVGVEEGPPLGLEIARDPSRTLLR
jgi:hypothetical protein